jgi:hypothetical protein
VVGLSIAGGGGADVYALAIRDEKALANVEVREGVFSGSTTADVALFADWDTVFDGN